MSINVEKMERVFKYNGRTFPDPNPLMEPEQLRGVFAIEYPEIASAGIDVEIRKNKQVITFQKVLGAKG